MMPSLRDWTAAALLIFAAIPATAAAAEPFRIGVFLSLTGDCADTGDSARKGIELAVEELNAEGGILGRPVRIVVEDSRESNSANAVTAYKQLILNPDIRYLIGPSCSPAGLAVAPLAARNPNIVLTSPSIGLRQFNEAGDNIFKLWPYDEDGPKLLAQYARQQGWRRVSIFSSQQAWEEAQADFFEAEFKRLGGEVAARVDPMPGEPDLRAAATRLIRANPDFIFLSNYLTFDIAGKELAEQGFSGPKVSTLMTEEKVERAKGALNATTFYGYDPPTDRFTRRFVTKYRKRPGSIGADMAYDAVRLYAKAINEAKTDDPGVIKKKLLEVKDYPGASGLFSVDAAGGVKRQPKLFRVQGREFVRVDELSLK